MIACTESLRTRPSQEEIQEVRHNLWSNELLAKPPKSMFLIYGNIEKEAHIHRRRQSHAEIFKGSFTILSNSANTVFTGLERRRYEKYKVAYPDVVHIHIEVFLSYRRLGYAALLLPCSRSRFYVKTTLVCRNLWLILPLPFAEYRVKNE